MARETRLLNPMELNAGVKAAQKAKREARFPDGGGLTLFVTPAGKARWVHRYSFRGRKPERMFPGEYPKVGLVEARQIRDNDCLLIAKGLNPVEVSAGGSTISAMPTFAEFAETHFARLAPPSERKITPLRSSQWFRDMTEVVGYVGKLPVDDVLLTDIENIVRPMWQGFTCTPKARRIVNRIARVLDHRIALENPNAKPTDAGWRHTLLPRIKARLGDEVWCHGEPQVAAPGPNAPALYAKLMADPLMSGRSARMGASDRLPHPGSRRRRLG